MSQYRILQGNSLEVLQTLPNDHVHCAITSPPYFPALRDYGVSPTKWSDGWVGPLGAEPYPEQYVLHLTEIFRELRRVLRPDGVFWLNIGDTYAKNNKLQKSHGIKRKDLFLIPSLVAQSLRRDGWYLRSDVIWCKPDALPSGVKDRFQRSHEYLFQFTKEPKYFFDYVTIKEHPGKNKRSVWTIPTARVKAGHFAAFPLDLAKMCIRVSTPEFGVCPYTHTPYERVVQTERIPTRPARQNKQDRTGKAFRDPRRHVTRYTTVGWNLPHGGQGDPVPAIVLDPFCGSGQTGIAAIELKRQFIGVELSEEYVELSSSRMRKLEI